MKFVLIILIILAIVIFTIIYFGKKAENEAFALQNAMRRYGSSSPDEQRKLYDDLVNKTASFCKKIGENEKAEKIISGKFDYRNLKLFEIRYIKN